MAELFLTVLNRSISASWLVLIVVALRFLLKKVPKWVNVLLWGLVAVRLICPFTLESTLSLIPSAQTVSPEIMLSPSPAIDSGIGAVDQVVNPVITESFTPAPLASANPLQILIPAAALVWCAGILLMGLYTLASYWRLRYRVRTAIRMKDNIYRSERISSPFVLGLFRPRIYLPSHMAELDMYHVIAHERTHIRRRDHWWKPLGFLLLAIYWFNPLMWLAYILLCRDIELACDEKVVKAMNSSQRADYSQALLNCSVDRRSIAACPLAFGEVGVKERVKNVLHYKKPAFWAVAAALLTCLVVAVCFLTNPKEPSIFGESYHVTAIVCDNKWFDFTYTPETAPLYTLAADQQLVVLEDITSDHFLYPGKFTQTTLTEDNFDPLFTDAVWMQDDLSASSLREKNTQAWELYVSPELPDSVFYYLLLQEDGEIYLTYGYRREPYSGIRWVFQLAPGPREENPEPTVWPQAMETTPPLSPYSTIDALPAAADSGLDVEMTVEDLSPTGATILFQQYSTPEGNALLGGNDYFLQRRTIGGWTDLPTRERPTFTKGIHSLATIRRQKIDWEWLYGTLDEGYYRIGKRVIISQSDGTEQYKIVYAEFVLGNSLTPYVITSALTAEGFGGTADYLASGGGYGFFDYMNEELVSILNSLSREDFVPSPGVTPNTTITLSNQSMAIVMNSDGEYVEFRFDGNTAASFGDTVWAVKNGALNDFFTMINQYSPENSTYETYNVAPLEDLPRSYSLEEATIDRCVIMVDGDVLYNEPVWGEFIDAITAKEESTVRLVTCFSSDSSMRIFDLSFDGAAYTLRWFEDGKENVCQYPYLLHFEGNAEETGTAYVLYDTYILAADNAASLEDVRRRDPGALPGAGTPYYIVYNDDIYIPKSPEIPALQQAALKLDGRELLTITDSNTLSAIQALFADAEALGYEPKTYSLGPELVLTGENGTEVAAALELDGDLCRIGEIFYDYGPGYTNDGSINALPKLFELLGISDWPDAVYEKYSSWFG